MLLPPRLRSLEARRLLSRARRRQPWRRRRPLLEGLEDRTLLSTFTVNSTLDDGSVGTLRWAVGQANSTTGADTIDFDSTVFNTPKTIALTAGQLTLTDTTGDTTIAGPSVGVTIARSTAAGTPAFRIMEVNAGVTASLENLTLTGGDAGTDSGGAIFNSGTLTLTNSTLSGNSANIGGGIDNDGTATLTNSTLSGNSASMSGTGGCGGAICNELMASLTLTNSTLSGNTARLGGGIYNHGTATLTATMLTLTNSTLSDNSADIGGGIDNKGTARLTNSTLSGNTARLGGGIYNRYGTATLNNTIVANSPSGGDVANFAPGTITGSHNLIEDGSGGLTDTIMADPMLGPLQNNCGPTPTMALLAGSPAIDAADPAFAPPTDQRGFARGAAPDIGAYEVSHRIVVTTAADEDNGTADPSVGTGTSLREAINLANCAPGADTIDFNIPGSGPFTIALNSPLPPITQPVVIDGYTQPGAKPNTLANGDNAMPLIELSGDRAPAGTDGLVITGGGSTIRGLVINRFTGNGIVLTGGGSNIVEGNFIGTDVTGKTALGNGSHGILISDRTVTPITPPSGPTVSGPAAPPSAIIQQVNISEGGMNVFQSNFNISTGGTTQTPAPGNVPGGIASSQPITATPSSSGNTIGGTTAAARNIISGNRGHGIEIFAQNGGGSDNLIQGNYIGTDVNGTKPVGNSNDGVFLDAASGNMIGAAGSGNIIANNSGVGIQAYDNSNGNLIQANTVTGNGTDGVYINGSSENTILSNVIAQNSAVLDRGVGVQIFGGTRNHVLSNQIQNNGTDGVFINSSSGNIIGQAGQGNVISGNRRVGVQVFGGRAMVGASNNIVQGNRITDNGLDGVALNSASGNTVGGNVITGNRSGVNILGSRATGNSVGNAVLGNVIRRNKGFDVALQPPVIGNVIGGPLGEANDLSKPVAVYAGGQSRNRIGRNMRGHSGAGSVGPHRSTPETGHRQRHKVR